MERDHHEFIYDYDYDFFFFWLRGNTNNKLSHSSGEIKFSHPINKHANIIHID